MFARIGRASIACVLLLLLELIILDGLLAAEAILIDGYGTINVVCP